MAGTRRVENTKLSKRLKKIFDQSLERKTEQRKKKQEEQKKKSGDTGETGEHFDANAPLKGVLGKGDNYPRRAYTYIKSKDGRGVYRHFDFPHLNEIRDMVRKRAEFPGGSKKNFNPTYTQKYPYDWAAHHLLPGNAYYYEIDGKPVFTFQQLRLVLQTDYNINHGHNLILLPTQDWACPIHTLICHPSDHENWNIQVMDSLKEISKDLQKKIDEAEPHETLKTDVFDQLKDAEEDAWDYLVELSRIAVPKAVRGERLVNHELLKYETEDKVYQYPALG